MRVAAWCVIALAACGRPPGYVPMVYSPDALDTPAMFAPECCARPPAPKAAACSVPTPTACEPTPACTVVTSTRCTSSTAAPTRTLYRTTVKTVVPETKDLSGCDADTLRAPRTRLQEVYREAETIGGLLVELNANRRPGARTPCASRVLGRMRNYCANLRRLNDEAQTLSREAIPIGHPVCRTLGDSAPGADDLDVDERGNIVGRYAPDVRRVRSACRRLKAERKCAPLRVGEERDAGVAMGAAESFGDLGYSAKTKATTAASDEVDAEKALEESPAKRPSASAGAKDEGDESLSTKSTGDIVRMAADPLLKSADGKRKQDVRAIREVEDQLAVRKRMLHRRLTDEHLSPRVRRKLTRQLLFVSRLIKYYRLSRRSRALNAHERELRKLRHKEVDLQHIVDSDASTPAMRRMAKRELCCLQKRIRPLAYRAILERQRIELLCALTNPRLSSAMRMALASHLRGVKRHIRLLARQESRSPLDDKRDRLQRRIAEAQRMMRSGALSPRVRRSFNKRLKRMRAELSCLNKRIALHKEAAEIRKLMEREGSHPIVRKGLQMRLRQVLRSLHRASGKTVACRLSTLEKTLGRQRRVLRRMLRDSSMSACVRRAFLVEMRHTCAQLQLLSRVRRARTQIKAVRDLLAAQDAPPALACALEAQLARAEARYARLLRALYRSLRRKRCISCCGKRFRQLCQLEKTPDGRETLVCRTTLRPVTASRGLGALKQRSGASSLASPVPVPVTIRRAKRQPRIRLRFRMDPSFLASAGAQPNIRLRFRNAPVGLPGTTGDGAALAGTPVPLFGGMGAPTLPSVSAPALPALSAAVQQPLAAQQQSSTISVAPAQVPTEPAGVPPGLSAIAKAPAGTATGVQPAPLQQSPPQPTQQALLQAGPVPFFLPGVSNGA